MIRRLRSLRLLALAVTLGACIIAGSAARASASGSLLTGLIGGNCGATSAVFAPWGDGNQYYFTQNGGFEDGSTGWTLSGGTTVVDGNEPFSVHSATDSHSLLIPGRATATSPSLCFGLLYPGVRFFATSPSGLATIHVRVIATGLLGALSVLDGGTATVGPNWSPTPTFATTLSQLDIPVGTKSIQLQITATGDVQIDDIYIDPFVSH